MQYNLLLYTGGGSIVFAKGKPVMPEAESQPTQQKLDEVEQKVNELEHEVKVAKRVDAISHPTESVKREAAELTTDTTKSPRKMLTIILIVGVILLVLGVLALVLTSGALWWLLLLFVLIVIILSDRLR